MCQKNQIIAATDVVTKIPDELRVTPEEVQAIVTVLRLLGAMLQQKAAH